MIQVVFEAVMNVIHVEIDEYVWISLKKKKKKKNKTKQMHNLIESSCVFYVWKNVLDQARSA